MKRQRNKLYKGIALFGSFYTANYFIGRADGLTGIEKVISQHLGFLPDALAALIASLVGIVIGITMVYCFVSGLYRISTFNRRIPEYENNKWE